MPRPTTAFYLTLLLAASATALKIAVFTPKQSNSQIIWNKRVSEVLMNAGHDVTMIEIAGMKMDLPKLKIHPNITVWDIDATTKNISDVELREKMKVMAFADLPMWDKRIRNSFQQMGGAFVNSCEKLVQDKVFLKKLVDAKFDIAFAHMYEYCPIGLIHYAKIPTWVWLQSGALTDLVAHDIGVHSPASYVPPIMSDASDEMTFVQRFKSQIGHFLFPILYPRLIVGPQTAVFRKHIDPEFPDLRTLGKKCPLVMVNSNELYDLPRPILHKVVYIGGLGMKKVDAKPLTGDFRAAVDKAEKVVVMTFGSVANTSDMPDAWKSAFMGAFARFPNVQFVMRYASDDLKATAPGNVLFSKWIPQADLLQHPNTAALISHGGYNSLQEAINAGKPIITIPLFGDQPRNGRIAAKHGIGYLIPKGEVSEEAIFDALKTILSNEKFEANANRLKAMIEKKPVQSEALLRRWTEFLAEFKTLDNLVPHGTKLGFIEYHNLDVLFVMFAIFDIALLVLFSLLKLAYRFAMWVVSRGPKVKTS